MSPARYDPPAPTPCRRASCSCCSCSARRSPPSKPIRGACWSGNHWPKPHEVCFPTEFAALDRAAGATFPFTREQIEAAHSAWTADWLAWEQHHDAEYKLKAAQAEHDSAALGPSTLARARIESVEREKLELYHRRYQDYIRTAKALQALNV